MAHAYARADVLALLAEIERLRDLEGVVESLRCARDVLLAREERRRTLAHANASASNPEITRTMVDRAADSIDAEAAQHHAEIHEARGAVES